MLAILLLLACDPGQPPQDRAGQPGVLDQASAPGVTALTVREDGARSSRVEVERASGEIVVVADRGNPDRAALSDDGTHVAWVSGLTGLASVYVARTVPDAPHTQVTNVGLERLERTPGQAPAGWVPPPVDDSLHFEGDFLVWDSPQGAQRARWR